MHGAYEFLKALTTVLCVAAVTTVLFHRLRQPVLLPTARDTFQAGDVLALAGSLEAIDAAKQLLHHD